MSLSKWAWCASRNCSGWQALKVGNVMRNTENFNGFLSKIVNDALTHSEFSEIPKIKNRLVKLIEYHTIEREPLQGQMTLLACEMLERPNKMNHQLLHQAVVVAVAVELIQSYFLIMDDVDDRAEKRHGKPCWHLLPEVNTLVMNDACMFRSVIHKILQKNFSDPLYTKLLDVFNEAFEHIAIGQHLDVITSKSKDYSLFTQENYDTIIKYKCTYYTMKFPIKLALLLCDRADKKSYKIVEELCKDVGALFQMKNDVMDCFDKESETGKTGSDIQEGKCTWLAVKFLERCNAAQRETFTAFYGSCDPGNVQRIKELYEALALLELYREDQNLRYDIFMKKTQELSEHENHLQNLFLKFLQIIQTKH